MDVSIIEPVLEARKILVGFTIHEIGSNLDNDFSLSRTWIERDECTCHVDTLPHGRWYGQRLRAHNAQATLSRPPLTDTTMAVGSACRSSGAGSCCASDSKKVSWHIIALAAYSAGTCSVVSGGATHGCAADNGAMNQLQNRHSHRLDSRSSGDTPATLGATRKAGWHCSSASKGFT